MCVFDEFLDDVRKRARYKMECKIKRNENSAALENFAFSAKPKFSEGDKEALLLNAESEAIERVLEALRKAAFPEELVSMWQ